MTTFCSKCGNSLAADANFCAKCGTPTTSYYSDAGLSESDPTAMSSDVGTTGYKGSTDYGSPPYGLPDKNPYDQSPYGMIPPPPPPSRRGRSNLIVGVVSGVVVSIVILGVVGIFAFLLSKGGNGAPSPTPTQIPSTLVVVQANSDWQSSGISVSQGTVVTVEYVSGYWRPWPGADFDGKGCTQGCSLTDTLILVGCNHGGLIGRIGSTQMICILDGTTVTATESGMLYLRINDPMISDDSGAITIRITLR